MPDTWPATSPSGPPSRRSTRNRWSENTMRPAPASGCHPEPKWNICSRMASMPVTIFWPLR